MKKSLIFISVLLMFAASITNPKQNLSLGDIVLAKCVCGFSQQLFVGGGRSNYETYCSFPFYCKNCQIMFCDNYLNEIHFCNKCNSQEVLSYNNDSLRLHENEIIIFSWKVNDKTFILTKDNYFCPQCQKFTLKFTSVGSFD